MSNKSKGFTLTELLVCIGILGMLIAILIPVILQSRRESHKAACQSNLRQIGIALRQYVSDNDETWPSRDSWDDATFGKQTLAGCPDAVVPSFPYQHLGVPGYAYNTAFTVLEPGPKSEVNVGVSDKNITYPSFTVVVCEEALGRSSTFAPNPDAFINNNPPATAEQGWMRHNGGCNYLFADGRVQWYAPDAVGANIIGTNAGMKPKFAL